MQTHISFPHNILDLWLVEYIVGESGDKGSGETVILRSGDKDQRTLGGGHCRKVQGVLEVQIWLWGEEQ